MKEDIFEIIIKNDAIYGIWHKSICGHKHSSYHLRSKFTVVMLHGWAGHRSGPHDMLVKLARQLSNNGYDCFRFDFRGKGYSQGDRRQTNNKNMLEDLEAVLQYVNQELECPKIVLVGICSGAKLALYYARNGSMTVAHVIEISSPVLRQREVEFTLATNQTKNNLKEYFKKVFRIETWRKLTGGEIHFQTIWRNISQPMKHLLTKKSKTFVSVSQTISNIQEKPYTKFKGQMLLIHGERDPETKPALEQIQEMLQHYKIPSDTYIVKNANHSFYSLAWENEIIQLIKNWLENK